MIHISLITTNPLCVHIILRAQQGLTTPFSQMTDILSSTPFTPLGIFVKSSLLRAFWHTEKVQLSVPVTLRSSLAHFHG